MATAVLPTNAFPPGTAASAYPASNWRVVGEPPRGAPVGSLVASATVGADGNLTFTGLADDTGYYAAALIGGVWKYWGFNTESDETPDGFDARMDAAEASLLAVVSNSAINVTQAPYFALPGLGDCRAAVQQAWEDATAQGRSCFIPSPTEDDELDIAYAIGSGLETPLNPAPLIGTPGRKSILRSDPSYSANGPLIGHIAGSVEPINGFYMSDITLDGDYDDNLVANTLVTLDVALASGADQQHAGTITVVEDLTTLGFTPSGRARFLGNDLANADTFSYTSLDAHHFYGVERITNSGSTPIAHASGTLIRQYITNIGLLRFSAFQGMTLIRSDFVNGGGYGVGLQGYSGSGGPRRQWDFYAEDCHFINNGRGNSADGIDVKSSARGLMVRCYAEGNGDKGINIRGEGWVYINCHANGNATGFGLDAIYPTTAQASAQLSVACSASDTTLTFDNLGPIPAGAPIDYGGANLLSNSRADNSTANWAAVNGLVAAASSPARGAETHSFEVTSSVPAGSVYLVPPVPPAVNTPACDPGDQLSLSGYAMAPLGARTCNVWLRFYNAANVQVGADVQGTPAACDTATWTRYTVTATAPALAAYARPFLLFTAIASGDKVHWTDLQLELAATATTYAPGNGEVTPGPIDCYLGTEKIRGTVTGNTLTSVTRGMAGTRACAHLVSAPNSDHPTWLVWWPDSEDDLDEAYRDEGHQRHSTHALFGCEAYDNSGTAIGIVSGGWRAINRAYVHGCTARRNYRGLLGQANRGQTTIEVSGGSFDENVEGIRLYNVLHYSLNGFSACYNTGASGVAGDGVYIDDCPNGGSIADTNIRGNAGYGIRSVRSTDYVAAWGNHLVGNTLGDHLMVGTHNTGDTFGRFDAADNPITSVGDPLAVTDAANKQWVLAQMALGTQARSIGNGPWYPGKAILTVPQEMAASSLTLVNGTLYGVCFTAPEALVVGKLVFHAGSILMVSGTLCRLGLATLAATNNYRDFTTVAAIDSDTTLFKTTPTRPWERALSTAGGYPATYTLTPGDRYAVLLIIVGSSTAPSIRASTAMGTALISGGSAQLTALVDQSQALALTGQTDIPASGTFATGSMDRVPLLGVTV